MMRMLNALITATCGSDVVVALGSGPFLAFFGCALFCVFSLIAWVNTHFWPGEMHFYPTLMWCGCYLPPLFVQFSGVLITFCSLFILTFRTEPLSFIGQSRRKKWCNATVQQFMTSCCNMISHHLARWDSCLHSVLCCRCHCPNCGHCSDRLRLP